jgi:ankyrin repeat protein
MMASEQGHVEMATTLLARSDIDVNRVSSRVSAAFSMQPHGEDTALLLSCRMGHVDIVRLLLARSDVDINVVNVSDGVTVSFGGVRVLTSLSILAFGPDLLPVTAS